ncbi:MAG: hypothetical protein [Microviridae sp.]|nr:MAG: hypothetical protein [Microviridae sp.]
MRQNDIKVQSNTYMNAEEAKAPNYQLVSRKKIDGTPFEIIGNNEKGYFLAFGKYRLTDLFETIEEVQMHIASNHWEITAILIAVMIEITDNDKVAEEDTKQTK